MRARRLRAVALCAVGAGVVTAGISSPHSAASVPVHPAMVGPKEDCTRKADQATLLRFKASDGRVLAGAILGRGPIGIVLVHQSDQDYCGFVPFARTLAVRGYRAFAISLRGHGSSQADKVPNYHYAGDVVGAAAELRRRGARRIFLMGGSVGGTAVVAAAPEVQPAVAGVIDLSGPAMWFDMNAVAAVKRLTVPILFVVSSFDEPFLTDTRNLYAAAASTNKRLVVRKGPDHGTALLDPKYEAPVRALVLSFLKTHSG